MATNLRLDWITREAAKYACEHWHYSRTLPMGKNNYIGVWEDCEFRGAIIFGLGASATLCKPYGLEVFQVCELVRVALRSHKTPVTRMIAIALRMLKKQNPGLRVCVSFADPFQRHRGSIYIAGGWVYTGDSSPSVMYQLPDGTMTHERRWSGQGWNAKRTPPVGTKKVKVPGKHRYVMPFDNEMKAKIELLRKPYPSATTMGVADAHSRAGGVVGDTATIHVAERGSIPTPALH